MGVFERPGLLDHSNGLAPVVVLLPEGAAGNCCTSRVWKEALCEALREEGLVFVRSCRCEAQN